MASKKTGEQSSPPLYHQLFTRLREEILHGRFAVGSLLPSEAELEREYGVSKITVRRALDELRRRGLVEPEKGRGVRVTRLSPVAAPVVGGPEGMLENNLAMGLETEARVLEFDYIPASEEIAKALALPVGTEVQHAVRLRLLNGVPFSYLTTFVPGRFGRKYTEVEMDAQPLLLLLLERTGVRVESANQTVTAVAAQSHVAELLDVEVGTALLAVERTVFATGNEPVELIIGLYRPDIYAYRIKLRRENARGRTRWGYA